MFLNIRPTNQRENLAQCLDLPQIHVHKNITAECNGEWRPCYVENMMC